MNNERAAVLACLVLAQWSGCAPAAQGHANKAQYFLIDKEGN
jgi:hypothetical protein